MSEKLIAVVMPKWGLEMLEGEITEWLVNIGDPVALEQDLVDIETSKIVNTLTSKHNGTLVRILAGEGETLDVGTPIAVIATSDSNDSDIDSFVTAVKSGEVVVPIDMDDEPVTPISAEESASASTAPTSISDVANKDADFVIPEKLRATNDDSSIAATPVARRLAMRHSINLSNIEGTGRHGLVSVGDLRKAVLDAGGRFCLDKPTGRPNATTNKADDSQVPATPVARRLATKLGVNLLDCRRTGRHQRVSKADVEVAALKLNQTELTIPAKAPAKPKASEVTLDSIPLSGIRKTIARRLQTSKREAPHFRACIEVEIDEMLALRKQLNNSRSDANISINDCLIKATAMALKEVPEVNIQFDGVNVTSIPHADIAVAVALEDGLITPIVTSAETKGLVEISNEMRDLATRAKIGKLKPQEFQGGSFSLSNLGMFGVSQFDAIINPPQAAILAVGASERKLLPGSDGEIREATMLTLTLSSDHRVVDGALAAKFLQTLKTFVDKPAIMLG